MASNGRADGPMRAVYGIFADAFMSFIAHEPFRLAAALSYYSLLSMAPLLLIVIGTAGFFFGEGVVREELIEQVGTLTGSEGAALVRTVIDNAERLEQDVYSILLGGGLMLFGATTVFAQLQGALNQVWQVKAAPENAVLGFLRHRLLSFALIVSLGFLLIVSLIASAILAALQGYLDTLGFATIGWWRFVNAAVSFAIATLLVAMIFKYLPDAVIGWPNVWLGALITSLLLLAGRYVIGLYLGQASIGSVFGAAGSVVVFMVWVYYAALIFFFGAEITRTVARYRGQRIDPSDHGKPDEGASQSPAP